MRNVINSNKLILLTGTKTKLKTKIKNQYNIT